jgi:hypothetical protein
MWPSNIIIYFELIMVRAYKSILWLNSNNFHLNTFLGSRMRVYIFNLVYENFFKFTWVGKNS